MISEIEIFTGFEISANQRFREFEQVALRRELEPEARGLGWRRVSRQRARSGSRTWRRTGLADLGSCQRTTTFDSAASWPALAPPKVIWLQVGNAGTQAIADLLRREPGRISAFEAEDESSLLIVRGAV